MTHTPESVLAGQVSAAERRAAGLPGWLLHQLGVRSIILNKGLASTERAARIVHRLEMGDWGYHTASADRYSQLCQDLRELSGDPDLTPTEADETLDELLVRMYDLADEDRVYLP